MLVDSTCSKPTTLIQGELFAHTTNPSIPYSEKNTPRTYHDLVQLIKPNTNKRMVLTLTENRVSMFSANFTDSVIIKVRMHKQFLSAPEPILRCIQIYLSTRNTSAWKKIEGFVQTIQLDKPIRSANALSTQGRFYNLREIKHFINSVYFSNALSCRICWGRSFRRHHRTARKSIRYGAYHEQENLIRINPLLDDLRVPKTFLEYIVFHEMLHIAIPSEYRNCRWNHHTKQFKFVERNYPHLDKMTKLSKELLYLL